MSRPEGVLTLTPAGPNMSTRIHQDNAHSVEPASLAGGDI